ncbi:MAG: alcohol dehydrogenase catalytic domain-containing protein, partial [Pseudomonadota bacterium]|nr:alcohol dehydrogenase catalytic domain-containing protein [Pseudomonadota bacterium]
MRTYLFAEAVSLDGLRLVERPDPSPGANDIVLRMRAAALNFRDLAMARGNLSCRVSPPLLPLSDGAGEIVEAGSAVTRFRVGDLACPTYLPDWIDGPIHPRRGHRRLGGPSDGVPAQAGTVQS